MLSLKLEKKINTAIITVRTTVIQSQSIQYINTSIHTYIHTYIHTPKQAI